ncbi:ATP-NAD kinase family protein [Azohydromonas caseinilytica]|uniref:Acetoin catabolism protein X n=1 Tax=Azohydromonas caseinilytica TaxID=2728836 RepID=A0A848FB83_9BURK|nr:NAD(+)/NADH kinase [Azohydromonas caseinilytica]NML16558.1 acetoin catabolism protein X [Azohydromonas caseinilytica]
MSQRSTEADVCVGIIANPVSARDIRRVVVNAGSLQIAERVSIVLRLLTTLRALGVPRVLVMPDKAGIRALLNRHLRRDQPESGGLPAVEFLDMDVTSTVEDTFEAARRMRAAGVRALIVLGGDGTHRAVVRECSDVPIAGLSTGTNNAFPELREPTLVAMAVALHATGRIAADEALAWNKVLDVSIGERRRDIALVDAVISTERCIGARALWKTQQLSAAYLTFADPSCIGLSAIGALLQPVGRRDPHGLAVTLAPDEAARKLAVRAPIAPGLLAEVPVAGWEPMPPGRAFEVRHAGGIVALDGERELPFEPGERVQLTLRPNAFPTVDVTRCLQLAAQRGLFHCSLGNH